ncbi:MAG TPA: metallopeptidase family protein [Thermoleophilia bacterium]|nr:metallopeptidase family protein [Thermoleophilia bacterium]
MTDDHELDPELERLLDDAWEALEDGDLRTVKRALRAARATAADDPAVIELEASLAREQDEPERALEAYRRWSEIDPDDPEPWLGSAEIYVDFGEPGEAARLLRELLAGPRLDPLDEADARHLLGIACEEKGDAKGMVKEWLATLRLDEANDGPTPRLSRTEFERLAGAALDELPEEILARLGNVPVFVEDRPSEALVLEGLDPRTLGLFHGIAMPDQSVLGPGPDVGVIHLFQRNLEREVPDDEELGEEIRVTVLHETAHYFGAGEQDMHRFGLN